MLLSEIVAGHMDKASVGLMLDAAYVTRCLKKAVRFYCGYQKLKAHLIAIDAIHDPINAGNELDADQDFDITPSELSIIRPLFELYVEHENAIMLEASRNLGTDPFGRSVIEIAQDINQHELDLPKQAFMELAVTI